MSKKTFLELFAGVGGLSEGFIESGFKPVAFIEKDKYCCDTLKTRQAYFHLKSTDKLNIYYQYLSKKISKSDFYNFIPKRKFDMIFNKEINKSSIDALISNIEKRLKNKKLDLILGGPPCQAYSLIGRAQNKTKKE